MNEILDSMKTRRSIRRYKAEQIPDDLLDAIMEAGLYAASGMNNQKSYMVAVQDKETIEYLSKMNAAVMGVERDPFYGAPCVIVVLADPERPTWVEDGSLVMGNLMLAAHSLGLGSCWIHRAKEVFDSAEGKALLKKWGLPETLRGVGHCVIGYADEMPETKARFGGRIVKV